MVQSEQSKNIMGLIGVLVIASFAGLVGPQIYTNMRQSFDTQLSEFLIPFFVISFIVMILVILIAPVKIGSYR